MAKTILNFSFHDPNSESETIKMLLKLFVEVNTPKVEKALKAAVNNGKQ